MARSRLSILSKAKSSDVRVDPFPHLLIHNALDHEIFAELNSQFPDVGIVMNGRKKADTWFAYEACDAIENPNISLKWQEFIQYHCSKEFYLDFLEIFSEHIDVYYPNLDSTFLKRAAEYTVGLRQPGEGTNPENLLTDVSLECQFYVNFTENPREVRGPHVDRPTELFAGLLYFRQDNDGSTGGDLEICRAINEAKMYPSPKTIRLDRLPMEVHRERVEIVDFARYSQNTLVFFLNTYKSLHSISERSATAVPRRHINFTADLFNLPAPELFVVRHAARKRLKRWLKKQPVAWRLASLIND